MPILAIDTSTQYLSLALHAHGETQLYHAEAGNHQSQHILPQIQALLNEKTALNHTVGQLRQMGVQPLGSVADSEPALLYRLETAPNQYQYYIGLNNFYTVWHYNHSRMYVTAVRDIANGMGGGL